MPNTSNIDFPSLEAYIGGVYSLLLGAASQRSYGTPQANTLPYDISHQEKAHYCNIKQTTFIVFFSKQLQNSAPLRASK